MEATAQQLRKAAKKLLKEQAKIGNPLNGGWARKQAHQTLECCNDLRKEGCNLEEEILDTNECRDLVHYL